MIVIFHEQQETKSLPMAMRQFLLIILLHLDSLNNDDPEFVIGAWMEVKNLKWSAPLTRILVHIGDAPSELWSNNKTRGETYIKRVMETLRCRLKISKYLYLKPNHVSGGEKNLREFIDTIKVHDS